MMKKTQCLLASMAISAQACLNAQAAMLDLADGGKTLKFGPVRGTRILLK